MYKRIFAFALITAFLLCMVGCTKQPSYIEKPDNSGAIQESDLDDHSLSNQEGSAESGSSDEGTSSDGGLGSNDTPVSNNGEDTQSQDTPVGNDGSVGPDNGGGTGGNDGNTVEGSSGTADSNSSTGGGSTSVDSGSGTVTTVPEKTEDCTYEEYHAMTPEAQQQFFAKFESVEAFFVWYNAAKAQHEKDNAAIEIGDGEIDLGEVLGSGK